MIHAILVLLATAITPPAAPVFEAQMVEETSVVGALLELTPERVVLDTPQGKVELELARLLSLKPKDARESASPAASPAVWVELADGSALAAVQYGARGDRAQITLAGGEMLSVPVKTIGSVRLQPETPKIAAEWSRILGLNSTGDILVVRNGDSVDYHQGVLRDVAEDAVRFELDGDALPIKRGKIYGFAYRHPTGAEKTPPLGFVLDRNGSRWAVAKFALGEKLELVTPGGVKVERSLTEIKSFDFSLGKVQYLSDLEPVSVAWTPFFGQGKVSPTLERFYAPRRDRNFDSNPLQLRKTAYSKGLALHSRTEIVFRLPEACARFKAVAGIDDAVAPKGSVRLTIRGDDKILFDSAVKGTDSPRDIDLDIAGARRLVILVDFGDTFGAGDHLILGNARIYK
ncbi:MAG: NPCBM/NEW2 domain-containing protein [Pirellulales bacterium]|nr:NPCBM/NEW2 domain-containing protein [Pirellulales bacterium]